MGKVKKGLPHYFKKWKYCFVNCLLYLIIVQIGLLSVNLIETLKLNVIKKNNEKGFEKSNNIYFEQSWRLSNYNLWTFNS